ncbi:hypothetical protein [Mycobacterium sp. 852002-51057_SCH5723018]|uniref:hypothetical protein n=1 Tax=Mycobacterium sp. 852002-51057_SCH5723018 TaxID=1834094 RepID=UPI0008025177|nr:hypothetical protein [Mycobacterium sp. 852002-51057_SCH5723018]OBG27865.1 hypothetical protein A5764_02600 [Mycobacterium sp. 852002-51057_SCH5723018]
MRNIVKKTVAGAVVGGAVLFTAGAGVAGADTAQGGLVNVTIGNVTVAANVTVDAAAAVVANACGVNLPNVNALVYQVSQTGAPTTVCQQSTGPVTVTKVA